MISKNSFAKMVLHDIRERGAWMLAAFIAFMLLLPVNSLLRMDGIRSMWNTTEDYHRHLTQAFKVGMGYDNSGVLLVIIAAAFFLGVSGFSYLYSREKTDFYHSLPRRREKLFAIPYVSGIFIFLIPYALNIGLSFLAGVVKGAVTKESLFAAAGAFITFTVFFLLFYHLAILAVLLTGNLFTGVMGFGAFLSYTIIVNEAFISLTQRFFRTTIFGEVNGGRYLSFGRISFHVNGSFLTLNPLIQLLKTISGISENGNLYLNVKSVAGTFLAVVILGIICVIVYRIRPSESHNKAIAFPVLEPLVKVAVVLPISVLIGIAVSSGMAAHNLAWFIAAALFAAAVLSTAMEFLYTMDLRSCMKPKVSSGVTFGGLALILVVFHFDVFGMDTYLPEENKIESMSLYVNELNSLYAYPSNSVYNTGNSAIAYLDNTGYTDFDEIYFMAREGVEYQGTHEQDYQEEAQLDWAEETTEADDMAVTAEKVPATLNYYVKYVLKSGREVYRFYSLPQTEELLSCVKDIYNSWEFKEKTLPVEFLETEDVSGMLIQDIYSSERRVELKEEDKNDFYNIYKMEWESLTFDEMQTNSVVAFITFSQRMEMEREGYLYDTYVMTTPIYENFEKSIQLLEKAGFHIYTKEDADKIENIKVTMTQEESQKEYTFTEEKDIRELLENAQFERYSNYLGNVRKNYNLGLRIQWKDDTRMYGGGLYLTTGELPECLANAMKTD